MRLAVQPLRTRKTDMKDPLEAFHSTIIDDIRSAHTPNVWKLPGGELRLPEVFGFCRGVKRALMMAVEAVENSRRNNDTSRLILLGEIIHNPWVNDYFSEHGVKILSAEERRCDRIEKHVKSGDTVIIPAFGVALPIEKRLREIGCRIIDCSCGDVIRLWRWSEKAVAGGYSILIFGRSLHDETVVTKSRLEAAGGKYLVVENLNQVRLFCDMFAGKSDEAFSVFPPHATNAGDIDSFMRLAQVSQTTMLYNDTMKVQAMLKAAFDVRPCASREDLAFQPTVCKATQARQNASVELCKSGCDIVIVVGGFTSSNTRHLYELARQFAPSYLIEDNSAIHNENELLAWNAETSEPAVIKNWLPAMRPLKIGILAGASSPEIVVGRVLTRLAGFLG